MIPRLFILYLYLLLTAMDVLAQITPRENAVLNYRLVGMSIPAPKGTAAYNFKIAAGNIEAMDSFQKNIVSQKTSSINKTWITVPTWQSNYTWQVIFYDKHQKITGHTPLYHFSTGFTPFADTSKYRLRVIDRTKAHQDLLFFSDCMRGMNNVNGEIVWYLPHMPGVIDSTMPVRDMKLTPQGTITFIANTQAYEITYEGKLLWKAPDDGKIAGDTTEQYHHEFTRGTNGLYLIAGNQKTRKIIPAALSEKYTDNENIKREAGIYYADVLYGTIIEYNYDKKITWSWKAVEHLSDSLLFTGSMFSNGHIPGFHFNSFYFDENTPCIYAGFRDINKIVKIAYPSGNVLGIYDAHAPGSNIPLLKGQHNCQVNASGNLYLFNNNVSANGNRTGKQQPATVMVLEEPAEKNRDLSVKWVFDCNIDNNASPNARGGGSVYELKDSSILVCMGTAARIFIVNKNKEVLWNAITELKNENRWMPFSNYRVYPVEGSAAIESMLFTGK